MFRVSYRAHFRIRPECLAEAGEQVRELFRLWHENVDTENMTLSHDPESGWFTFDTGGDCQVPRWITDDTPILLRQLGRYSRRGTMVYHGKGGERFDFPVGPNVLSERQAREMEKLIRAEEALREVRAVVPDDALPEVDRVMALLNDLRA